MAIDPLEGLRASREVFAKRAAEARRKLTQAELEFQNAQSDLEGVDKILARQKTMGEQFSRPEAATTTAKRKSSAPQGLLDLAEAFDTKRQVTTRVISDERFKEAQASAEKLLRTKPKSVVLYLTALFILKHSSQGMLSARELVDNLPPILRSEYNDDVFLATENARSQLRKKSRPHDSTSDITYDDGAFVLVQ